MTGRGGIRGTGAAGAVGAGGATTYMQGRPGGVGDCVSGDVVPGAIAVWSTAGICIHPPCGGRRILSSGAGGRPSGTGDGRGNKAWAGGGKCSAGETIEADAGAVASSDGTRAGGIRRAGRDIDAVAGWSGGGFSTVGIEWRDGWTVSPEAAGGATGISFVDGKLSGRVGDCVSRAIRACATMSVAISPPRRGLKSFLSGIGTDPSRGERNAILSGGSGDRDAGAVGAGVGPCAAVWTSGRPCTASGGLGETDAMCVTASVGMSPPHGGLRTLALGGSRSSGARAGGDSDRTTRGKGVGSIMASSGGKPSRREMSEAGVTRAGCGTGRTGVGDRAYPAGGNGGAVVMRVTARTRPPCCGRIGLSSGMGGGRSNGTRAEGCKGDNQIAGSAGSSDRTGWGITWASVTADAGNCSDDGVMGAAGGALTRSSG